MADIAKRPIDTFTLGFHGDTAMSEHTHAALVSRHIGARHHVLMIDPGDMLAALGQRADTFDEPADPAALPTMLLPAHPPARDRGADGRGCRRGFFRLRQLRDARARSASPGRSARGCRRFATWCARPRAPARIGCSRPSASRASAASRSSMADRALHPQLLSAPLLAARETRMADYAERLFHE